MSLEIEAFIDEKNTEDDDNSQWDSDPVRCAVEFDESLCVVRCDETNNTLKEDNPSYESDEQGPAHRPDIVREDMCYSEHQRAISQEDHHAFFLYQLEECLDALTIDEESDTCDDEDESPELCEKWGDVHKRKIRDKGLERVYDFSARVHYSTKPIKSQSIVNFAFAYSVITAQNQFVHLYFIATKI